MLSGVPDNFEGYKEVLWPKCLKIAVSKYNCILSLDFKIQPYSLTGHLIKQMKRNVMTIFFISEFSTSTLGECVHAAKKTFLFTSLFSCTFLVFLGALTIKSWTENDNCFSTFLLLIKKKNLLLSVRLKVYREV